MAKVVFTAMRANLLFGNGGVTSEQLLFYKKRVRDDTLRLLINKQLQFLSLLTTDPTMGCPGYCVMVCHDSALMLDGYQNTNKSGNKTNKIEVLIDTLKIGASPVNVETLFCRTKVAWDWLVKQKATPQKLAIGELVILKLLSLIHI